MDRKSTRRLLIFGIFMYVMHWASFIAFIQLDEYELVTEKTMKLLQAPILIIAVTAYASLAIAWEEHDKTNSPR